MVFKLQLILGRETWKTPLQAGCGGSHQDHEVEASLAT
jgi:hypothetical protein